MKVMRINGTDTLDSSGSSSNTTGNNTDHLDVTEIHLHCTDTGTRKRQHNCQSQQHQGSLTPVPSLCPFYSAKEQLDHSQHQHYNDYHNTATMPNSNYTKQQPQQRKRYVLVTGGAGYIGSHTVLELLNANYSIVVMDNLVNSNLEALARVEYLSGKSIYFVEGDITCEDDLDKVFKEFSFWAVIHFAAIKAVGQSTEIPLDYYHNNVTGSLNLFRVMNRYKVKNLVFSSSATVYGEPEMMPVNETASLGPVTNPYGRTKLFVEKMLQDICMSDPDWNVCLLRFFNPVGAHPSGLMGECPQGIPNNLLPYVIRVLQGHLPYVQVFGSDYDTVDGTGVRDYIHVCDLATGHVAALKKLELRLSSSTSSSSSLSSTSSIPDPSTSSTSLSSPLRSSLSSPSPLPSPIPSSPLSSASSTSSAFTLSSPVSSPSSSLTSLSSSPSSSTTHGGQCTAYNLGTGTGYSVLEIIHAMEKATQKTIPYKIMDRRRGDVAVCIADAALANQKLGWKPLYTMDDMCEDMWRWTRRNPNGYDGPLIDDI